MNISTEKNENLEMRLEVTLTPEDYTPELDKELKTYRKKAKLKGFRQGKAPLSIIRKMYGQQILAEVISRKLNDSLQNHLREEKLDYFAQPMPVDDQEPIDFDSYTKDYTLTFELGLKPDIDLEPIMEDLQGVQYKVEAETEDIDNAIDRMRKQSGSREEIEEGIEKDDLIDVKALELEDGEIKEDGWQTDFMLLVNQIQDEEVADKILGSKVGDTFDFDIYKIERDEKSWVEKHLLHKEETDETEVGHLFRGEITRIERLVPAELNQDLYDNVFGKDEVSSEEEAREKIKEMLETQHKQVSEDILTYEMRENIIEKSAFDLPERILKKWVKNQNEDRDITDEDLDGFITDMRWTIIREKIAEKNDIQVSDQEVFERMLQGVKSYMAQYGQYMEEDQYIDMADRMMEDSQSYHREKNSIMDKKLMDFLKEKATLTEETVTAEELRDHHQEIRNKIGR